MLIQINRFLRCNLDMLIMPIGTPIGDYSIFVDTLGAEPQEGGGIAQARSKGIFQIPGIPVHQ